MLTTWEEIEELYHSIKHTTRASKNLKIWGEVLASAFMIDRTRANKMWQHVVELNTTTNPEYAKYFVGQIYNKIVENLPLYEATEFLLMEESRRELLFLHGFDGGSNNECIYRVVGYYLTDNNYDKVFELLSILAQKRDEEDYCNSKEIVNILFSSVSRLNKPYVTYSEHNYEAMPEEVIVNFLAACETLHEDSLLGKVAYAHRLLITQAPIIIENAAIEMLTFLLNDYDNIFLSMLYLERTIVDENTIAELLELYCEETHFLPINIYDDMEPQNRELALWLRKFFDRSEKIRNDVLIRTTGGLLGYETNYLNSLLAVNEGKKWVRLLASIFKKGDNSYSRSCLYYVEQTMQAAMPPQKVEFGSSFYWRTFGDGTMFANYTDEQRTEFAKLLAVLCSLITEANAFDQLYSKVKNYVRLVTGSLDILDNHGFEASSDKRTALEVLRDYCVELTRTLPAHEINMHRTDSPYFKSYEKIRLFLQEVEKDNNVRGFETGKLLAQQEEIMIYLFLHDPHLSHIKSSIIMACLINNKVETAMACFEKLVETATYPNFTVPNGWELDFYNTIHSVIADVALNAEREWGTKYSESVRNGAILIAENSLQYLNDYYKNSLKRDILRLKPAASELEQYISDLLRDVSDYTAIKPPRGFGKRANNVTSSIINCVPTLCNANRVDVIVDILHRICEARSHLQGPQFMTGWVDFLTKLDGNQLVDLYVNSIDVFEIWLQEKPPASDKIKYNNFCGSVMRLARRIGSTKNKIIFIQFRNQVIQHMGYLDEFDDCLEYSSDLSNPIFLEENKQLKVEFLYFQSQFGLLKISFRVKNKGKEPLEIGACCFQINETSIEEKYTFCAYLNENDERVCELSVYMHDLENLKHTSINKIVFGIQTDNNIKRAQSSVYKLKRRHSDLCFEKI